MAGKFAIMGFFNRLDRDKKDRVNEIIDGLIQLEKESKTLARPDDLCDMLEMKFSNLLSIYRR